MLEERSSIVPLGLTAPGAESHPVGPAAGVPADGAADSGPAADSAAAGSGPAADSDDHEPMSSVIMQLVAAKQECSTCHLEEGVIAGLKEELHEKHTEIAASIRFISYYKFIISDYKLL